MESKIHGERGQQFLAALGRKALQNNSEYTLTNLKESNKENDFTAMGQTVIDRLDLRGQDGAEELRNQIRMARQLAIQNGMSPR